MCLEVRIKQKKTQFIVLPNWNPCGMWPAEWSWGKHDVTVPIAMGYKENKSCRGGKKRRHGKNL